MTIKLKSHPKDEEYPRQICAIAGCSRESEIIDATREYADIEIPLCDFHWEKRCQVKEFIKKKTKTSK